MRFRRRSVVSLSDYKVGLWRSYTRRKVHRSSHGQTFNLASHRLPWWLTFCFLAAFGKRVNYSSYCGCDWEYGDCRYRRYRVRPVAPMKRSKGKKKKRENRFLTVLTPDDVDDFSPSASGDTVSEDHQDFSSDNLLDVETQELLAPVDVEGQSGDVEGSVPLISSESPTDSFQDFPPDMSLAETAMSYDSAGNVGQSEVVEEAGPFRSAENSADGFHSHYLSENFSLTETQRRFNSAGSGQYGVFEESIPVGVDTTEPT